MVVTKRQYVAVGASAGIRGPDGVYRTLTGRVIGSDVPCEHCDGERSPKVRIDALRGLVCPPCDSALDEMLGEGAFTRKKAVP